MGNLSSTQSTAAEEVGESEEQLGGDVGVEGEVPGEDDDEDGREACGERRPVDIDQAESIVRLVEVDIR